MHKLKFSAQAQDDLKGIARYIANETSDRAFGARFAKRLRERCQRLARFSHVMGRQRPELAEGLRSISEGNYMIFFRYLANTIEVVRITEGHRDMATLFSSQGKPDDQDDT